MNEQPCKTLRELGIAYGNRTEGIEACLECKRERCVYDDLVVLPYREKQLDTQLVLC